MAQDRFHHRAKDDIYKFVLTQANHLLKLHIFQLLDEYILNKSDKIDIPEGYDEKFFGILKLKIELVFS